MYPNDTGEICSTPDISRDQSGLWCLESKTDTQPRGEFAAPPPRSSSVWRELLVRNLHVMSGSTRMDMQGSGQSCVHMEVYLKYVS